MATTGELHAIIKELGLEDIGDAASYLGEEVHVAEEFSRTDQSTTLLTDLEIQSLSSHRCNSQGR